MRTITTTLTALTLLAAVACKAEPEVSAQDAYRQACPTEAAEGTANRLIFGHTAEYAYVDRNTVRSTVTLSEEWSDAFGVDEMIGDVDLSTCESTWVSPTEEFMVKLEAMFADGS